MSETLAPAMAFFRRSSRIMRGSNTTTASLLESLLLRFATRPVVESYRGRFFDGCDAFDAGFVLDASFDSVARATEPQSPSSSSSLKANSSTAASGTAAGGAFFTLRPVKTMRGRPAALVDAHGADNTTHR
jgi:hypothetical protein